MKHLLVILSVTAFLFACNPTAEISEVTRVVKETVESEVTRVVEVTREVEITREVKVTRIVEVTSIFTPTPPPSPTPEGPNVGDFGNPHLIGNRAYMAKDGEQQFTVTINEILRGDEAIQRIKAANQFNDAPPDGFEFVLLRITIEYISESGDVLEIDENALSSVTNGRIIAYTDTFTYSPCCLEPPFEFSLLPGGTGDGWVALPVAIDDKNPMLLIGTSDNGVYFLLSSPDE